MIKCQICKSDITVTSCKCESCKTQYQGTFYLPRLARLSHEEQKLAEALILHGGNLKELAENINLSYPTLKKRLKELSVSLEKKKAEDEAKIAQILQDIESKKISAQEGMKLILEINGEL